jgi:hypothetical protein
MIIHASYFVVSKSDNVSWNLIWVLIKFWSNINYASTTAAVRNSEKFNYVIF